MTKNNVDKTNKIEQIRLIYENCISENIGDKMLKFQEKLADKYKYRPLSIEVSEICREAYIKNIPIDLNIIGDNIPLYTLEGTKICTAYDRIVVGDYGAFVEISILSRVILK